MTKRELAFVGCKVLGLYFIANCLSSAQTWIPYFGAYAFRARRIMGGVHPNVLLVTIYALLPLVAPMIVGCIFWFAAAALARRIAPEEPEKT